MNGIEIQLRLLPGGQCVRPTAGLFIGQRQPEAWLSELARVRAARVDVQLLPIRRQIGKLDYYGVLVIPTDAQDSAVPAGAIPYRSCKGRLFFPSDARFDPEIDDAELSRMVPDDDCISIWPPR